MTRHPGAVINVDGDKGNNRVDNLEWVTPRENSLRAYRLGLSPSRAGENHPQARLTWADVEAIRRRPEDSQSVLAAEFGVTRTHITDIRRGRTWKT